MRRYDAIRKLRANLLRRREAYCQSLDLARSQLHNKLDRDVADNGDFAHAAEFHEINSQLAQVESAELTRIDVALQRIGTGDYGVCDDCRCSIPLARLRAVPYATLCIKCQCNRDNGGARQHGFGISTELGENNDLLLNSNGVSAA